MEIKIPEQGPWRAGKTMAKNFTLSLLNPDGSVLTRFPPDSITSVNLPRPQSDTDNTKPYSHSKLYSAMAKLLRPSYPALPSDFDRACAYIAAIDYTQKRSWHEPLFSTSFWNNAAPDDCRLNLCADDIMGSQLFDAKQISELRRRVIFGAVDVEARCSTDFEAYSTNFKVSRSSPDFEAYRWCFETFMKTTPTNL